MKFDFGEVLTRAWKITWKYKALWLIGVLFGFLVSLMFPLLFAPVLLPVLTQSSSLDMKSALIFMIGMGILVLLFIVVLYPVSVFVQSSLTLGILNANEEGSEPLSAMDLIKKSVPFFWRVLGLMILFAVGMGLFNLVIQGILVLSTILTLGIATICMMPLMLLMYPVLYGAIVWLEQAMNAIIVDHMTVMDAAKQSWKLLRNNPGSMALMALVIYLGVGIVTGVLMLPMMLPFFILPFGFLENQANWGILLIAAVSTLIFIPLFSVITGMSMIFTKSAWVLAYLRLTRAANGSQPLPGIVEAIV
jgi:hypothetical protein